MKKIKRFIAAVVFLLICAPAFAGTIRLSSTIGPVDAGIIPLLADNYKAKTGTEFVIEKAGTGATLEKAKTGNFDLVVVHARALEDRFIAEGYGQNRRDFMYNDFVILGPEGDPAGIKGMKSAAEALKKIAEAKAPFISRGDMSGTHVAEMKVWRAAGISPDAEMDEWYTVFSLGKLGNGPTTIFADKRGAYTLMDRATYLTRRSGIKIVPLVEGDPILLNLIAAIEVSPKRFPKVNNAEAVKFVDWLCGDEAQTIIKDFKVSEYGEPLFFPNSDEWNKKHGK
ncbi:substrate-binding domain-containing protein [Synergistes jonesii]|uniref:Tungsten ABC transporter permease n=1 Tax=Synergistes jonesii TaxID=2754 RepID=A0A073J1P9_9BACT|nr:substrate-binding domain-containing protein [Synergistes jonesii]KEJ91622.1 tungsten ABC transporter permease [Synergistes jonesii]MDY2984656.1 substrate-binding domain-containing protein [Synergistes jonesii]OFB60852.1 tungsten ABC transporter permease [Synergistes jonesii]OFB61811.1 tungsten ABC transporter permease [Synergistes jonesii]OFB62608.1 tungsten ABC transporter permease [Synergistes jonesii]